MTSLIKVPFASSGDKTAVPDTDATGAVNMTQGYGLAYSLDPATDPSAKRIERDKMNWLFNRITQAINEIQVSGVTPFITSADNGGSPFSYGKGAIVSLSGAVYQSLVANNTTTPPGANWSLIPEKIQPLDATLTALAALTGAADKLAYFNGAETAALTALTGVGRDIIGKTTVADVLTYLQLRESFSGVVGQSRNARMNVTSASASATFTADEIIVETSTGQQYRLNAFNQTVNLGTTGAGGMDSGVVPTDGYVALYAIYNPTTNDKSLIAVNATSSVAPEIYGGANMPSGYTASALISVWHIATSKFVIGVQRGRKITFVPYLVLASSISAAAFTSLDVSGCVPRNAQSIDGNANPNISGTGYNTNISVASLAEGIGAKNIGCGGAALSASFSDLQIVTSQTIYYTLTASTSLQTSYIYITGYEI